MKRTEYFQSARAAFQGGGVKGVALIGAYKAAIERGVNFSEVAGTSAGAVIAALIGGGASPRFLIEKASATDFSALLSPPSKEIELPRNFGFSLAAMIMRIARVSSLSRIVKHGGVYSSQGIEQWIDEQLQDLLSIHQRTVQFNDLPIPTTIVAADLTDGRKKIWSSHRTPDESVAYAVRCSSSIPGFFQPVAKGTVRYADGGILSNLPAFVYANDRFSYRQERILAFRLVARSKGSMASLGELFERVIETVVDGAVEIQQDLIQGVHEVEIVVDGVRAADFHSMTARRIESLIDQGYQSATKFFEREASIVAGQGSRIARDVCRHEGDLYANLVEQVRTNIDHVLIAKKDTRWFWQCFPTFLAWRLQGIPVTVLCGMDEDIREQQRRSFLKKLGASVTAVSAMPLEGFMYMAESVHSMLYLALSSTDSDDAPHATVYRGVYDEGTIRLAYESVTSTMGNTPKPSQEKAELKKCDSNELIERLKVGVSQYSGPDVSIAPELIDVKKVKVLNRYLRAHKYKQVHHLHDAYQRFELTPFEAASICIEGKEVSIMTPPVVEEHNGSLVAIEGNTRLFYCLRNGITSLQALVVRGVADPLPGVPRQPQTLIVDLTPRHGEERIEGFAYEHFRKIERAVRPLE